MSFLRKSIAPEEQADGRGLESLGWNRDLTEIPPLVFTVLNGCTEVQIRAGISVSSGHLVVNTQAAVDAGADADHTWSAEIYEPVHLAGSSLYAGCERDGSTGSDALEFHIISVARDADDVGWTPPWASTPAIRCRHKSNGDLRVNAFGDGATSTVDRGDSPARQIAAFSVPRRPLATHIAQGYYGVNATYSSRSGQITAGGTAAHALEHVIGLDKKLVPELRIARSSTTEQKTFELAIFELTGVPWEL